MALGLAEWRRHLTWCRAGHQVEIFEAANYVGGLASGIKEENWDWSVERFYHHWFQSDRHMLGLIDELGLER